MSNKPINKQYYPVLVTFSSVLSFIYFFIKIVGFSGSGHASSLSSSRSDDSARKSPIKIAVQPTHRITSNENGISHIRFKVTARGYIVID